MQREIYCLSRSMTAFRLIFIAVIHRDKLQCSPVQWLVSNCRHSLLSSREGDTLIYMITSGEPPVARTVDQAFYGRSPTHIWVMYIWGILAFISLHNNDVYRKHLLEAEHVRREVAFYHLFTEDL
mmetsp:Transcript_33107/g.53699  ORF Transcript_33107/g.53699 Transcript_33107/m.53699 type:complete len:125 (+) Transcript_33107:457-831(+)